LSGDLNPRVAAAVLVVAVAVLLLGGWFIWFRKPPQVMPPGVTDPAKLTEDYYAGRYRPGVGYVNAPQAAPAPAQPGGGAPAHPSPR
jgi:hypothetical protein